MRRWLAPSLAAWAAVASCGSEQTVPATEVVLLVHSDLTIGAQLTKIEVTVQTADGARTVSSPFPFALAAPGDVTPGKYALPFSFGVHRPRRGDDRFRVVVRGYAPLGASGSEIVVIEQRAQLGFVAHKTLRGRVFLGRACFQNLCDGASELVCSAGGESGVPAGRCGALPTPTLTEIDPGTATDVQIGADVPTAAEGAPDAGSPADAGQADAAAAGSVPLVGTSIESNVRTLAASSFHVCALRGDGTVVCWGSNDKGRLGNGTTLHAEVPVVVSGLTDAEEIAAGLAHTCARRRGGTVVCWGENREGALGAGAMEMSSVPVAAKDLTDVVEIAAGMAHTCARRSDDSVACWGWNLFGQLGDGTTTSSDVPVNAPGLSGLRGLATTLEGGETCGIERRRSVRCVSTTASGTVESGALERTSDIWSLAATDSRTCVADLFGEVSCRGTNDTLAPIEGVTDVAKLSVSDSHTCAVRRDGTAICWGRNNLGQLGGGTRADAVGEQRPTAVRGLTNVTEISNGTNFSCARRSDGSVWCWGENRRGLLGPGSAASSAVPVRITGL